MPPGAESNIGIISDTHGLLRPQAIKALSGVDFIIHAGDIGSMAVMQELREVAPVVAIRGNIDKAEWAEQFPLTEVVSVSGKRLYVLHNLKEMALDPVVEGFDAVIAGHSHKPGIERRDGVLYLNPGSAGPRRFKLPVTLAKLYISPENLEAQIVELPL